MSNTPLGSNEPQSLGYDPADNLLSIQGFVPASVTSQFKADAQQATQFSEIALKPASEQAKFFLNARWPYLNPGQAERYYNEWKVFKVVQKEAGIAEDSPNVSAALARLFLDRLKRTTSATEFTAQFKDIDTNFDGNMAFIEYLVWDNKGCTPATVIYAPQVQGQAFFNACKKVIAAEGALRENANTLAAKEEAAASLEGVKKKMALNDLATFKENNDVARMNADVAAAHAKLLAERKKLKELGTEFWEQQNAAALQALKPQKAQK